jgi:hypothetical protein
MKKLLILLIAALLLAACTPTPSTPPPGAVDTAVAKTFAAWTAAAPESTKTPIPTNTTTPTAISSGQTSDDIPLPESTATPTSMEFSTDLIIDVTKILGKAAPEVEEIIGKSVFITPNDDNDDALAGGEYRDYEMGKYYVFLSFDQDGIARGFQVLDGLLSENYALSDWATLLPRFGLNVIAPPDQEAPAALYWYNSNGYGIAIVSNNTSGKPVRTVQIEDSNIFMR